MMQRDNEVDLLQNGYGDTTFYSGPVRVQTPQRCCGMTRRKPFPTNLGSSERTSGSEFLLDAVQKCLVIKHSCHCILYHN